MLEVTRKIVTNVLVALYQPFSFAVVLSVVWMFLYLFAKEHGWKALGKRWVDAFKHDREFRKNLLLVFYAVMILFRTLVNRNMWANPVSDVIGVWGLYNENGALTTEAIENVMLFVPFTVLLFWCYREKILGQTAKLFHTLWTSLWITFSLSLGIEFLQLFLRLGTFQLSDFFYNTMGGLSGGLIYWIAYKIRTIRKHHK